MWTVNRCPLMSASMLWPELTPSLCRILNQSRKFRLHWNCSQCLHNNTLGTGSSYLLLLALLFLFPFCQILSNSPTLAVLLLTTCSLRWPPLDLLLLLRLPLLSNLWFPDPMTLCWPLTRSKSQLTWEIQGWASIQCCFLILHWNAAVPTGLAQ